MLHCSATALHTAHLLAPQLHPLQQREGGRLQGRALVTLAFRTLSPWVLQLLNCRCVQACRHSLMKKRDALIHSPG